MSDQNYIDEISQLWDMVKETFKDKEGEALSDTAIGLWFDPIRVVSYRSEEETGEMDILTLGINSTFKYQHIKEKFLEKINRVFNQLLGFDIRVELVKIGEAAKSAPEVVVSDRPSFSEEPKSAEEPAIPNYSFEYTFENFIVGSTNKFAHAACFSVANNPVNHFNPLFIYGNSGLGKTHLLCAIVNRLKQNNPNIRIIWKSDSLALGPEGCLSVPSRSEQVPRSSEIVIEYTDLSAERKHRNQESPIIRDTVRGFTAVIFQHETDHLDGILYIDRL